MLYNQETKGQVFDHENQISPSHFVSRLDDAGP